jgi:hypothetical protein
MGLLGLAGKPTANPAGSSANCRNDVAFGAVALARALLLAHWVTHLFFSSRDLRDFARRPNPAAVITPEMPTVDRGLDASIVTDSQYGALVP